MNTLWLYVYNIDSRRRFSPKDFVDSIYCYDGSTVDKQCHFGINGDITSPLTDSLSLTNISYSTKAGGPGQDACKFTVTPSAPTNIFITAYGKDLAIACVGKKGKKYEGQEIRRVGTYRFEDVESTTCLYMVTGTKDSQYTGNMIQIYIEQDTINDESNNDSSQLSAGAISGIVLAGALFLGLSACCVLFLVRRFKPKDTPMASMQKGLQAADVLAVKAHA